LQRHGVLMAWFPIGFYVVALAAIVILGVAALGGDR
jgi:hypothetical protein